MLAAAGAPSEGVFASIIGTVTLVFAAIGVVVQLKEALNVVWEVKPKPGGGIWGFTRSYVLSWGRPDGRLPAARVDAVDGGAVGLCADLRHVHT